MSEEEQQPSSGKEPLATPLVQGSMDIIVRQTSHLPSSPRALYSLRQVSSLLRKYQREHSIKRLVDIIARKKIELEFQSIAILSLTPGEGRSFFTAVLASSLAEYLAARVLVVDASGRPHHVGMLSVLEYNQEQLTAERHGTEQRGSCKVVTVAELFGSENPEHEFRVGEIIRRAQRGYDLTLVDTQALRAVNTDGFDAALVAQQVDATLAVLSDKTDGSDGLDALKERLESITTPCIGCVVNSRLV